MFIIINKRTHQILNSLQKRIIFRFFIIYNLFLNKAFTSFNISQFLSKVHHHSRSFVSSILAFSQKSLSPLSFSQSDADMIFLLIIFYPVQPSKLILLTSTHRVMYIQIFFANEIINSSIIGY